MEFTGLMEHLERKMWQCKISKRDSVENIVFGLSQSNALQLNKRNPYQGHKRIVAFIIGFAKSRKEIKSMNLYYKLRNGKWVSELAIETAFLVTTGKERDNHKKEFLDWLESHLNTTILEVKASTDPGLFNEILNDENKIMAIRIYRDKHGCTLAEAKDAVEWLLGGDDDGRTQHKHPQT